MFTVRVDLSSFTDTLSPSRLQGILRERVDTLPFAKTMPCTKSSPGQALQLAKVSTDSDTDSTVAEFTISNPIWFMHASKKIRERFHLWPWAQTLQL